VDGLWATKNEGVGLISFQDFQSMWSWSTNVTDRRTDRQTDRRTTCNLNTALCTSASRGKNVRFQIFTVGLYRSKALQYVAVPIPYGLYQWGSLSKATVGLNGVNTMINEVSSSLHAPVASPSSQQLLSEAGTPHCRL